jgi:hypothetical protein
MTTTATTTTTNLDQKRSWLDVLGILHYVYGGFIVAALVVGLAILVFGVGLAAIAGDAEPGMVLPIALASFGLLFGFLLGVANLAAGRWLRQRRSWVGIVVVAAINCLNVPLGTLLGVFTIVVLAGDDVQGLFGRRAPAPAGGVAASSP